VTGGFVGVDLFFVISGFLITRNILADIQAGTWSYGRFYTRRVRRLFPALFVTLALSFVGAVWLLHPNDLKWFAETAVHSAVSTSNFLYWLELGYFGPAAERTPLLHTWSLSVEEQFYLVWPALVLYFLAAGRGGRARAVRLLAVLLGLSVVSIWAAELLLSGDRQAAFYLMPFRFAEFAAGAVLVWLPRPPEAWRWSEELLLAAGLALVAVAVVGFDRETPFPGVASLVPVAGAALLIYAGRAPRLGRLLTQRPLVWVGLVSYSLYLVHWPLLVFSELELMRAISGWDRILLGAAALGIAWAMWRWVERPFREAPRRPRHLSPAAFGLSCAGLTILLLWTSSTVMMGDGWPWRIPESVRAPIAGLEAARNAREVRSRTGTCHMNMWAGETADGAYVDETCLSLDPGRPNYLLVGDSHGADRYTGLSSLYTDVRFLQLTTASCRPLLGNPFDEYHCQERLDYVFHQFLPKALVDGVILAGRWRPEDLDLLADTLGYLRGLGLRVIVLGPTAEFEPWVADLVFRHGRREGLEDWVSRFLTPEALGMERLVGEVVEASGAEFWSSIDALCPDGRCPVLSPEGELLIVDYGHQSPAGALVQARGYRDLGLRLDRRANVPRPEGVVGQRVRGG
jgi:peptidoglycan/LPS O-acetylase OafA/YrhL